MSFILPPRQGGSSSQHRPPRRNATLPVSSTRSHSSPPQTAPPTQPSRIPSISRAGNENGGIRSDSHRSSSAHPLQAEINRLMASCEDHELKIRSAKQATIEHRLFSELPAMLSKLNETDERAEQIASQISVSLQSNLHPLQSRLDNLVLARRNDVETMKERTTPWKDLSSSTNGTAGEKDKGSGRIQRMTGISATDGLGRIEKWAEEVVREPVLLV
ncbi:hypothetical protein P7C73_g3489, partial [Tremellales sp. Uapishka_1]